MIEFARNEDKDVVGYVVVVDDVDDNELLLSFDFVSLLSILSVSLNELSVTFGVIFINCICCNILYCRYVIVCLIVLIVFVGIGIERYIELIELIE